MNVREPKIRQVCTNCLRNYLLGDHQTRNIITLGGAMEIYWKELKLELTLARRLWLLDTLLVLRTKTVQCPLGLEIIKGHRVEGERRVARQTLTRLDSSLPTPNCASCHKKDKELLKLSFVLFAYSFILQMLFLCHFPLNVISYFRTCG